MIGLPFTVYRLPHALRLALCVKGQPKAGSFGPGFFILSVRVISPRVVGPSGPEAARDR